MPQPEIDWYIAFNGGNTDMLSRILFKSISQYCDVSDVKFHLVDNGDVRNEVDTEFLPKDLTWYTTDETWKCKKQRDDYYAEAVLNPWTMATWMVENCGSNQWCLISHFDMVLRGDILKWIRERTADNVGIIGTHCPLMVINKKAYKKRRVEFTPNDDHDVGILLEEDLVAQGWAQHKFDNTTLGLMYHLGAGASYHNKSEFDHMRSRAIDIDSGLDLNARSIPIMDQIDKYGKVITITHFTYELTNGGNDWRIACMPNMTEFHQTLYHPAVSRSNDVRAVSCPACKDRQVFLDYYARLLEGTARANRAK